MCGAGGGMSQVIARKGHVAHLSRLKADDMHEKASQTAQAAPGTVRRRPVRLTGHRAPRFDWADTLLFQIRALGLPLPIREYQPLLPRKWRLDCAWPDRKLFAECDGGEFLKASARRHGGAKDCERWNTLTLHGWTGYRFVGSQVQSGYAISVLEQVIR